MPLEVALSLEVHQNDSDRNMLANIGELDRVRQEIHEYLHVAEFIPFYMLEELLDFLL